MNADLHCHSVVSDGTLTPEALAARAKANGVELWALTDHDEVGGQDRALAAAQAQGLPYLTGTEISITFANQTVHIVGLGFDAHKTNAILIRSIMNSNANRALKISAAGAKHSAHNPERDSCSLQLASSVLSNDQSVAPSTTHISRLVKMNDMRRRPLMPPNLHPTSPRT